jgi:hypothetical protein
VDELQRKLLTEFLPSVEGLSLQRLACTLHNGPARGGQGHVLVLQVPRSARVHSVVNGGTYIRLDAGNRIMSASEVTELSYRRGDFFPGTDECATNPRQQRPRPRREPDRTAPGHLDRETGDDLPASPGLR